MDGDASSYENPISPVPTDDEFLRVVTDRIPVRVGYVDHEFRYIFLNGEYERMFGFAPREAWGKTVREIVGDHAWNIAEPHIRRALAGEAHTQEFTTRYAFGERRVEARYVPDFGPDGAVRGVVVNALDVTARYRVEQALRTSEERYRTIFESIDEGFCVIEMIFEDGDRPVDFRYLETNPAFQRLTGMPHDTVASGKTVREIVPEYEQGWIDFYGHVALTGEPARVTDEVKGLNRWFEVSAARIGNPTKRLVAVVFNDITARKRAEQEQVRLLSELSMEREKLRTVFEQAPAFLALLRGNDFVFEYTNEAYASLIGHRDVVGKPVLEALPEVADQGFGDLLSNVVNTGEPFVGREVPIFLQRTPDSTPEERYLDFVYQPVRDGGEEVYGVLAHGVDVTDQVIARKLVAQSEEQFRTVFENAPDAILVMDKNLELLGWNPAAEAITGWSAAEAIGQSAAIIFTSEDRAVGLPSREAATAAREGKSIDERWHCRRDGERFWGSGTMNALFHADGTLRGFLKVFRDATERYEMERQIREMNEQLEIRVADRTRELRDTVRETEAFNYSISHDLRAPLRAISATSRILLEDLGTGLDSEYRELLSRQA
ncbi:PAS domain S-box protein, partial [bacterium]